jgi:hypothetical protein
MHCPEPPSVTGFQGGAASFWVLRFSIYAFCGWCLETSYRSANRRRFVNAGFLRGPFLPIYGLGAVAVLMLAPYLRRLGFPSEFLAYGLILTAIEYAVGIGCEKAFGVRMWDYSEDVLNLHGRVCLPFSLLWAFLATLFERRVDPSVVRLMVGLGRPILDASAAVFVLYFRLDFCFSMNLLRGFVGRLSHVHLRRLRPDHNELKRLLDPFGRLLEAFPNLHQYLDAVLGLRGRLNERLNERLSAVQLTFLRFLEARSPREEEYRGMVRELAVHPEFSRTKEFPHHDRSIYRHAMRVSVLSYRLGKLLRLDARAMARGGLLHDFFLYDWRHHDLPELAKEKFHGLEHPRIALENSRRHFLLTGLEEEIIVRHMWPLTPVPPRSLEAFLVGCVDKVVAVREFRQARRAARNP